VSYHGNSRQWLGDDSDWKCFAGYCHFIIQSFHLVQEFGRRNFYPRDNWVRSLYLHAVLLLWNIPNARQHYAFIGGEVTPTHRLQCHFLRSGPLRMSNELCSSCMLCKIAHSQYRCLSHNRLLDDSWSNCPSFKPDSNVHNRCNRPCHHSPLIYSDS
jgi:hypothetical protein